MQNPPLGAASVMDCIELAKRALLQARVQDFTSADVVQLASIIEARDRALRSSGAGGEK